MANKNSILGRLIGWFRPRPVECWRCGKPVVIGAQGMLMCPDGQLPHDCGEGWMEEHGYAAPLSEEKPRG